MRFAHWNYYLSIEQDFIATINYAELDPANQDTFSIEYTKLLFSACSEIDVICRLLCRRLNPSTKADNIDGYRTELLTFYPHLHIIKVQLPKYERVIQPWESWGCGLNPDWWHAYNNVKHQRDRFARQANQGNALLSMCALFGILLYYYQPELYSADLAPLPALLDYERMPGHLLVNSGAELPDIPRVQKP